MSLLGDTSFSYNNMFNDTGFNGDLVIRGNITVNNINDLGLTASKFVATDGTKISITDS